MRRAMVFTAIAACLISFAAPAAPAQPAAQKNIVQTAVAAGQFTTLVKLVKEAGLAGALSTKTVTVFAPTDAAFAKVPKATLAKLAKDKVLLRKVLLYHVVAGRVPASKAVTLTSAKTLEGSSLTLMVDGSTLKVDGASVVKADVLARNGIIHVIDKVLIPAS